MYKSFKIKNFRCFEELELNELAEVNLIAGENNVGKTALLEALFLHCGMYNPELAVRINVFRGIATMKLQSGPWTEHPLNSIFNKFDISGIIELSGEDDKIGQRIVKLSVPSGPIQLEDFSQGNISIVDEKNIQYNSDAVGKAISTTDVARILKLEYEDSEKRSDYYLIMDNGMIRVSPIAPPLPFQVYFLSSQGNVSLIDQAELYGNLVINNKEDDILEVLKIIEPRLTKIRSVGTKLGSTLHGDIGMGRLVPFPLMGAGIVRLTNIALHIANAPDGVVLVDEIENGLHHSIMTKIWEAISLIAKRTNTQIFATTHSWECIRSAHEAFSASESYDFRLHRLEYLKGKIHAVTYSQKALDSAIKFEMEVR